jgi:hypothetical protein
MGRIARIAAACGFALSIVVLFSIGAPAPAKAQGGIVCSYGPKKYRTCCHESYREHPRLSARARERSIDACMHPEKKAKEHVNEKAKEHAGEKTKEHVDEKAKEHTDEKNEEKK